MQAARSPGLPVFFTSRHYRLFRVQVPFGPPWQWVSAHSSGNKKPGAVAGFNAMFAKGKILNMAKQ
jgi:hypothetical protein